MLFVAIHEHRPETCPADLPNPMHQMMDEEHITASGVQVVASYAAPPEHTVFFVLEATEYSQLVQYFRPLMTIGTPRIYAVQPFGEAQTIFPER
jgi:hypothetical protein